MDSSGGGQHKEMGGGNSLENMLVCSKVENQEIRKARPQQEEALKCPRCESINTKFCYYNNYSLSQPRYFCKSCRRYWTKGGTLRNVPVGGGCRKNKRSSSSSSSSSSPTTSSTSNSSRKTQIDHPHLNINHNSINPSLLSSLLPPNLAYDSNDLTLAFARLHQKHTFDDHRDLDLDLSILGNPNSSFLGFLENQNQNGFYGYTIGNGEMMEMPNYDHHQDVATTQAVSVATMKQEFCNNDEGKILWGFPWQINGSISDLESGRSSESSWNNNIHGIASSWHNGLLNTPLM